MSHMVIYRTADGQPGYHQTEELEDAVQFVERLRNTEGVDGPRIFRMEEVSFDFRPYFRVEIGSAGEQVALPASPSAPDPAWATQPAADPIPGPVQEPVQEPTFEPMPDPVAERIRDPFAETVPPPPPAQHPLDPEPVGALDGLDGLDAPPAPPPAPAVAGSEEEDGGLGSSENGLGARRGLFGR